MIIDTTQSRTEQATDLAKRLEEVDKFNRRLAKCGLGCFPVLNICPICNETIMTSSSLPLLPGILELDSENRVTHYHCLMGTDKCEHKNFTSFWFKHEFKGRHSQKLMAQCSECPVTWYLKETAENMARLLAAGESDE